MQLLHKAHPLLDVKTGWTKMWYLKKLIASRCYLLLGTCLGMHCGRVPNTYEFNQSIDESKMTRNVGLYSSSWKLDYRIYFRTKAEYVKTALATNILRKDCYTDKTQMCYNHINAGKITLLIFQMLYIYGIIKLVNIFNVRLKTFEYWNLVFYPFFCFWQHIVCFQLQNISTYYIRGK